MFSTSSLYFLVAIFGESIESSEAHGLQLVEGQEDETTFLGFASVNKDGIGDALDDVLGSTSIAKAILVCVIPTIALFLTNNNMRSDLRNKLLLEFRIYVNSFS